MPTRVVGRVPYLRIIWDGVPFDEPFAVDLHSFALHRSTAAVAHCDAGGISPFHFLDSLYPIRSLMRHWVRSGARAFTTTVRLATVPSGNTWIPP
jgi:hypothetical protein